MCPDNSPAEPYGILHNPSAQGEQETNVYKRRWYVLFLFCYYGFIQAAKFNTWGPISDSAELVFNWDNGDITIFAMVNNATYCLATFFITALMDTYGLRLTVVMSAFLLLLGSALRCITSAATPMFWLSLVDQLLGGVAGIVAFAGPPLFSSTWFPASQRTLSTSMIVLITQLGLAFALVFGPFIVKYEDPYSNSTCGHLFENISSNCTEEIIDSQRSQIMKLMYIECGMLGLLFVLILAYFPAEPPLPPSISAATVRQSPLTGMWTLTKKLQFWLLTLAFAVPSGVANVFSGVINIDFRHLGVSQTQGGWIGFWWIIAGGTTGVVLSLISSIFSRRMKYILIVMYVLASGSFTWLVLLGQDFIHFNLVSLYMAMITGSMFMNGTIPLFYELSCETFFPVAEGIIGGYLTLLNQIIGIVFLALFQDNYLGSHVDWINWTLLLTTVCGIPLLVLTRDVYGKLELDENVSKEEKNHSSPNQQNGTTTTIDQS